jgi:hypothetical protein
MERFLVERFVKDSIVKQQEITQRIKQLNRNLGN